MEELEEETLEGQALLRALLTVLQYFILSDKYEYMVELIKKKKKELKNNAAMKERLHILSKFMIALDIHVYLKYGLWSSAVESMLSYLKVFDSYMTYTEKVDILS